MADRADTSNAEISETRQMLELLKGIHAILKRNEDREVDHAQAPIHSPAPDDTAVPTSIETVASEPPEPLHRAISHDDTASADKAEDLNTTSSPQSNAKPVHASNDMPASMAVLDRILGAVTQLRDTIVSPDEAEEAQNVIDDNNGDERKTHKLWGMKKGPRATRSNPLAANYDYLLKYPHTERYHELDEDARVWWVYNDEAKIFDDDSAGEWGDSLDILLVFAGLFSAVLTTFVVETSSSLSQDPADLSVAYLAELVALQRSNSTYMSEVPTTDTSFSPSATMLWVNGLWFTSLVLSLSVALFAVLAKQWIRQYMSIITGSARERALIRQFRLDGITKWRVQTIIGVLPIVLHLSLILFLVGMVIFLVPLSRTMAIVAGVLTALVTLLYLVASVLPVFDIQCPYRTTFTDPLLFAEDVLLHLYHLIVPISLQSAEFRHADMMRKEMGGAKPSSPKLRSLKDRERAVMSLREAEWGQTKKAKRDQTKEYRALVWLGQATSSPSAKEVIRCVVGAFNWETSKQVDLDELHNIDLLHDSKLWFPSRVCHRVALYRGDKDTTEALLRSTVHLPWYSSDTIDSEPLVTDDIQMALSYKACFPQGRLTAPYFNHPMSKVYPYASSVLSLLDIDYLKNKDNLYRIMAPVTIWHRLLETDFDLPIGVPNDFSSSTIPDSLLMGIRHVLTGKVEAEKGAGDPSGYTVPLWEMVQRMPTDKFLRLVSRHMRRWSVSTMANLESEFCQRFGEPWGDYEWERIPEDERYFTTPSHPDASLGISDSSRLRRVGQGISRCTKEAFRRARGVLVGTEGTMGTDVEMRST